MNTVDEVKYKVMKWDVWRSGVPRIDDSETDAPDGEYTLRLWMPDYNDGQLKDKSSGEIYAADPVILGWESMLTVQVKSGNIHKIQALKAAGHLVALCGYPGRKLRHIKWEAGSKYFDITVCA